jgi:hypothetical protein
VGAAAEETGLNPAARPDAVLPRVGRAGKVAR